MALTDADRAEIISIVAGGLELAKSVAKRIEDLIQHVNESGLARDINTSAILTVLLDSGLVDQEGFMNARARCTARGDQIYSKLMDRLRRGEAVTDEDVTQIPDKDTTEGGPDVEKEG